MANENLNMDIFSGNALDNIVDAYESSILNVDEDEKKKPEESDKLIESEEPEKIIKPSPSGTDDKDIDKDKNPLLLPFAKFLEERGYFEIDKEKGVTSFDDIDELLNKSLKEREFSKLTPKQKEVLQWIENGVPEENIINHEKFQQAVSNIDDSMLEDEGEDGTSLRENILRKYYSTKNMEEDEIDKTIKRIIDSGEDIDESKKALVKLKDFEQKEFQALQERVKKDMELNENKAKENLKTLKTYINTTKEIIPGLTITHKQKEELYDKLTKPVSYREIKQMDGSTRKIPNDVVDDFLVNATVEDRAKLAYYITLTEKFTKHDMFSTKKAKSQAEKELEEAIRSTDNKEFQKSGLDDFASNMMELI